MYRIGFAIPPDPWPVSGGDSLKFALVPLRRSTVEFRIACCSVPAGLNLQGLRPLPPTPADSRIFGFFDFSKNVDFWNFPVRFGVWEGLQWIGNGCGLQMDGFSAKFEPYESNSVDFYDFDHFAAVSDRLTLFPEGPGAPRDRPEGPGTL